MGGSGCGKTTLMVFLTRRMRNPFTEWGVTAERYVRPRRVEFVAQKEMFFPYDTPVRHLVFLRQRKFAESMAASQAAVEETLRLVGLTDESKWAAQIGEGRESAFSGGERRLLTVAAALVSEPDVVILDEPTSGMDSYTAYSIVQHLRHVAVTAKTTFVVSIHQPSEKVLGVFDYVERMTPPSGPFVRAPAIDGKDDVSASAHANTLPTADAVVALSNTDGPATIASMAAAFKIAHLLRLYLWRAFIRCWTNWRAGPLRLNATLNFAVMTAVAFVNLHFDDGAYVRDILGMSLALIGLSFSPILLNATLFATERDVLLEEHVDLDHTALLCDSIARWISDLFLGGLAAVVLMIAIPIVAIPRVEVGWFFLTMWMQAWAADSFGYWISMVAAPHIAIGIVIPTVGFLSVTLGTGLMQPEIENEGYIFHVVKWLSFFKYGFQALVLKLLPHAQRLCPNCLMVSGPAVLDQLHLTGDSYPVSMGFQYLMLFGLSLVMRAAAFVTLRGLILIGNRRYSYDNSSAGAAGAPEPIDEEHDQHVPRALRGPSRFDATPMSPVPDAEKKNSRCAGADRRGARPARAEGAARPVTLRRDADVASAGRGGGGARGRAARRLQRGERRAVLGDGARAAGRDTDADRDDADPEGEEGAAGRAVRVDPPAGDGGDHRAHGVGEVAATAANGCAASAGVSTERQTRFFSTCAGPSVPTVQFVDGNDQILPNLRALEPVAFHASLYDPTLSASEVNENAALQLLALGIHKEKHQNMAYTLSGGQMRRLSVACKTVMQPSVLLIDEPTSGLDHDAAINLGRHLKNMAKESGVAVVCSLQQPATDLLSCFDTFIFMREGRIVVQGSAAACRAHFNVADSSASWAEEVLYALSSAPPTPSDKIETTSNDAAVSLVPGDEHLVPIFHAPRRSMLYCVTELTKRSLLNRWVRAPGQTLGAFVIRYLLLPVALSILLVNVGSKDPGYFNRSGLLFVYCTCSAFSSILNGAITFPTERRMVEEEIRANLYTSTSYLISQWFTLGLLEDMVGCVLGSIALKYIATLDVNLGLLIACTFTISQGCNSLGYLCGLFRDLPVATGMTMMVLMPSMLGADIVVTTEQITRIPLLWVFEVISFVRYPYMILFKSELEQGEGSAAAANVLFRSYGLDPDNRWYTPETLWPVFVCYALLMRVVVVLVYRWFLTP
ncbi:ABC transporter, putative [Bodo saltans]|uniref:ABC transporter, putative n=1 Tax=Bodo saltans TaxID=75058 RepID=A0A0S4J056_BODSA|nr:ABC transporter, putative [Bodo saltans]|eukprot:CUG14712.1 ABC transporter, putative [Bodo saltans]